MSDSREQFEEWVRSEWPKAPLLKYNTGDYRSETVQQSWTAWQASRQTMEIELPQQSGVNHDWNQAIRYCHQAIEAAGVRVKP